MISPLHVRMARAALKWSLSDLAERAQVNLNTISRYEAGKEILSGTLVRIEKVLQDEGIVFFVEDELFGPGVRLQKTKSHGKPTEKGAKLTKRRTRAR